MEAVVMVVAVDVMVMALVVCLFLHTTLTVVLVMTASNKSLTFDIKPVSIDCVVVLGYLVSNNSLSS